MQISPLCQNNIDITGCCLKQLQGSLLVTLKNSMTGQPIDDGEVRRKFQQFGDVKEVREVPERPE
jgi:hypothetical protein